MGSSTSTTPTARDASSGSAARSSKATRDRGSVVPIVLIAVAIVAIVAGVYFYLDWQRTRPATLPAELQVTASAGGEDASTLPFSVCEFGAECPEGDVMPLEVDGADTIRITVPQEVSQQQWSLLSIYDDPAANSERTFAPGEAAEVDVPVSATKMSDANDADSVNADAPRIVVVEVSTLLIDYDDTGEEIPVVATWSFTSRAD